MPDLRTGREGEIMVGGEPKRQLGMEGQKTEAAERDRPTRKGYTRARRKHEYRAHPDLELGSASEGLE